MAKMPKTVLNWGLVFVVAGFISLAGCTKHANEEQLSALAQTEQAANAAEKALADCESDQSGLKSKLSQKKRDLKRAKDEMAAVKGRLGQ